MITSRANPLIREVQALVRAPRRDAARVIVEGWRAIDAAARAGAAIETAVFTSEAASDPRRASVRARLASLGAKTVLVAPDVFAAVTQVEHPQGALVIAAHPAAADPDMFASVDAFGAVLDGVQDPGNVGAIVRTAAAAGATAIATVGAAADPFGPKALRASAGAAFRMPSLHWSAPVDAAEALSRRGVQLYVADPHGDRGLTSVPFVRPLVLVFGNEGAGADQAWGRAGAVSVRIPTSEGVESLNVAAAAAVLLYRAAGLG